MSESKANHIPERLRLPDGREFVTQELFAAKTRSVNYNLTHKIRKPMGPRRPKYTLTQRRWFAEATLDQIQTLAGVTLAQARNLQSSSRLVIKHAAGGGHQHTQPQDFSGSQGAI
jgi:acetoin utilization deacetylase AcuC-like enzyme